MGRLFIFVRPWRRIVFLCQLRYWAKVVKACSHAMMNPKIHKMEKVKTWRRAFLKFFFSREIVKQQKTFEEYFDKENYLKWKRIIFVLRTAGLSIFL